MNLYVGTREAAHWWAKRLNELGHTPLETNLYDLSGDVVGYRLSAEVSGEWIDEQEPPEYAKLGVQAI